MDPENKAEEPFVPYGTITSLDQLNLAERYSYANYFRWKFQEGWKDGKYSGLKPFTADDEISPSLFPDLKFKVSEIVE